MGSGKTPLPYCSPVMLRAVGLLQRCLQKVVVHLLLCHFHLLSCSPFCPSSCLKTYPANTHIYTAQRDSQEEKGDPVLVPTSKIPSPALSPERHCLFSPLHLLGCHLAQKAKSAQPLLVSSAMAEELRAWICKDQLFSAAPEHWL